MGNQKTELRYGSSTGTQKKESQEERCVGVSLKEGQRQYMVEPFHFPGWVPLHRLGMRLAHLLSLVMLGLYSRTFPSHATLPSMTLDLFQVFLQNTPGGILVRCLTALDGFGRQQQAEGKHLRLKLVLKELFFQVPHRKSLSFLNAPACNVLLEKVPQEREPWTLSPGLPALRANKLHKPWQGTWEATLPLLLRLRQAPS